MKYKQNKFLITIFLLLIITLSGCLSLKRSTIHPNLMESPEAPRGYIEFFVPSTWAGLSGRLGVHRISFGEYELGRLYAPQYPFQCTNVALATSLFYARATLPPGEHELKITLGNQVTPYKFTIYKDRLTLVRLESEIIRKIFVGDTIITYFKPLKVFVANTTLPKPKYLEIVRVEVGSLDSLIQILQDDDWGMRNYATLRIKLIGDSRALPNLEEAFSKEKNESVKKTISDAIKSLK